MSNVIIYLTLSCPFCTRAKMLLDEKEVTYTELRVDSDNALLEEMYQKAKRFTVPQIFIDNAHIGGFDDMYMLDMDNKLDPLLFPDDKDLNS